MPSESIPAVGVFFISPPPDSCLPGLLPARTLACPDLACPDLACPDSRLLRSDHSLVQSHQGYKSYIACNHLLIGILHFFCSNFNLHQTSR
jgi:hypothetical protein